jgi:RNA recognition motif-containing protein
MRLDRFTFHNDSMCFVELGSEEEAAKAIEQLDKMDLQGKKIVVLPLKADFQWGPLNNGNKGPSPYGSHYFYDERNGAEEALRPLGEGRRILLHVQTPGWTSDVVGNQSRDAIQIIQETFDQYGIEKIGKISPFYGDKQKAPRLLCFMDFKTKEGTDEAIQKHHDTEIKGRLTWLTRSSPVSWRTHQFAKVVPQLVAQLQEQGILSKEPRPDKFANPLPGTESK